MNLIKSVSQFKNKYLDHITIESSKGFFLIENNSEREEDYKKLGLSESEMKTGYSLHLKHYSNLSKAELLNYQIIILNAYFFQMDKVEDFKVKDYSIESIKEEAELIVQIRVHLRSISKFIDSYEESKEVISY